MDDRATVLAIEDDRELLSFLESTVGALGYRLDSAADGPAGFAKALTGGYELIIVDINLPSQSGFDLCRELRAKDPFIPLLVLTCRDSEVDRVLGLELGADDYVTKPFSVRELEARIRALLRRGKLTQGTRHEKGEGERLVRGDLDIDRERMVVTVAGKPVHFTAIEYELLVLLAANPGRVFTREELMMKVWGYHHSGVDPTLTKHLSRVRLKIEPTTSSQKYIKTMRGKGYRFASLDEL
jgi:DNA-binding response OmpR family regulator